MPKSSLEVPVEGKIELEWLSIIVKLTGVTNTSKVTIFIKSFWSSYRNLKVLFDIYCFNVSKYFSQLADANNFQFNDFTDPMFSCKLQQNESKQKKMEKKLEYLFWLGQSHIRNFLWSKKESRWFSMEWTNYSKTILFFSPGLWR